MPFLAIAATDSAVSTAKGFIDKINSAILFPLIALMMAIALIVFLYGAFEYVRGASNETAREHGRKHLFYGVIGFLVMLSAMTILSIAAATFGLDAEIRDTQPIGSLDKAGSAGFSGVPGQRANRSNERRTGSLNLQKQTQNQFNSDRVESNQLVADSIETVPELSDRNQLTAEDLTIVPNKNDDQSSDPSSTPPTPEPNDEELNITPFTLESLDSKYNTYKESLNATGDTRNITQDSIMGYVKINTEIFPDVALLYQIYTPECKNIKGDNIIKITSGYDEITLFCIDQSKTVLLDETQQERVPWWSLKNIFPGS